MNEIIKGMANAAEAIQENFTEQGERLAAVEQNIDLAISKVKSFKITHAANSSGAVIVPKSVFGIDALTDYVWSVSPAYNSPLIVIVGIQVGTDSLVIYIRESDGGMPPSKDYTFQIICHKGSP